MPQQSAIVYNQQMSTSNPVDLLSDEDKPNFIEILHEKLEGSIQRFKRSHPDANSESTLSKIKSLMTYKEDLIFTLNAGAPFDYFSTQWNFIKGRLPTVPYNFQKIIADLTTRRVNAVVLDLEDQKITIEEQKAINNYNYDVEQKKLRASVLQGQSEQIKQKLAEISSSLQIIDGNEKGTPVDSRDIYEYLYSKQKKLQVEQFLRKKRQQKQQRKKKLEELKIKQEQDLQKKEKELQQLREKQIKERRDEFQKKNLEFQQRRKEEKIRREQQNEEYDKLIKNLSERPRLFEVLEKNYENKNQYEQMQRKHRMISQKKAKFLHIDDLKIQEHEKEYEKIKKDRASERQKRYDQFVQEQQKVQVRHSSALQFSREPDRDSIEKEKAKQKLEKIRYFQNVVKQKFKPKVDESKRKEMLTLIQQLELNSRKKLKKIKLVNGTVIYEEVKEQDPKAIGMQYLEKTKQMAVKARALKGSSSVELETVAPKKKQFDYLQQIRKNPKARPQRKLSFVDRPNLSFDEKIERVLAESEKLNSFVKRNEMKLKFGKFKTSEQILICKQQIDQSYLDIAKMKLKLIKDK